ncbi:efflux RND transporter periplasmic adaptor subunit [Eisenibacter elegans]|uniref:efflux RND transporter periplasmic adaptor subunit n=1 Tax=Eisenibacter elegans TaxID=997 RepID=UPI00047DE2B5|nr:efflux RND transporter periplasmic adaptor subunit [Eisenibacter elegans]
MTRVNFWCGLLFIGLVSLAACNAKNKASGLTEGEVIAVKTHPIAVANGKAVLVATGILSTQNQANYSFKIGGVIDRILVEEGQAFGRGQLLATLKLTEVSSGEVQAQLALEKAHRDHQRVKNLYADSVATLEQLQNTQTALEIAKKQLEAVSFNRQYAYIYAANSGFVRKKLASKGEVVSGGMPVLAINESRSQDWDFRVGLSDREWALVEIGNPCKVVLDAFPDKVFEGEVFRKSPAAEQGTGSFQVEIKINTANIKPALGMFGKASIATNRSSEYITIPYDALIEADGKNAFVFVPIDQKRVRKQAIQIESFDNEQVRVRSGLEGVREVVRSNSAFLNEDSHIKIVK